MRVLPRGSVALFYWVAVKRTPEYRGGGRFQRPAKMFGHEFWRLAEKCSDRNQPPCEVPKFVRTSIKNRQKSPKKFHKVG